MFGSTGLIEVMRMNGDMIVGSQIEFAFLFPKMCYSMVPACLETGIFDVTLEIKGAKVCGKYSADGNDRFCGFDVMLESPIVIEANEVVTLTARIKGQSSTMGVLGKTSVECHGVLVTFSNAHSPNHQNSTWMGQFPNIILSI